jgi:hypothetical protein
MVPNTPPSAPFHKPFRLRPPRRLIEPSDKTTQERTCSRSSERANKQFFAVLLAANLTFFSCQIDMLVVIIQKRW